MIHRKEYLYESIFKDQLVNQNNRTYKLRYAHNIKEIHICIASKFIVFSIFCSLKLFLELLDEGGGGENEFWSIVSHMFVFFFS